jgi:hypothetical protein
MILVDHLRNFEFTSSVGRRESFDRVRAWYDRAKQLGGQDIEPVLIGNKSDINRSLVEVLSLTCSPR